jgi:hypothetical protein
MLLCPIVTRLPYYLRSHRLADVARSRLMEKQVAILILLARRNGGLTILDRGRRHLLCRLRRSRSTTKFSMRACSEAHWCAPKGASGKWPGRVAAPPRPRSLTVEKLYPAEFIEQQPSSTRIEAPDLPQLFVPVSAKLARWRSAASCFADQKYRRRCVSRRRHDADTRLLSSCVPRAALESGNSHP